jgi:hypothetical protein
MADAQVRSISGRKSTKTRALAPLQALTAGTANEKPEAQLKLAAARLADPKTSARDFASILKLYREVEGALAATAAPATAGGGPASERLADAPWDDDI